MMTSVDAPHYLLSSVDISVEVKEKQENVHKFKSLVSPLTKGIQDETPQNSPDATLDHSYGKHNLHETLPVPDYGPDECEYSKFNTMQPREATNFEDQTLMVFEDSLVEDLGG